MINMFTGQVKLPVILVITVDFVSTGEVRPEAKIRI